MKLIYMIHKHYATHLHYDLRLEMDGVLKSWAVPKEPSNSLKRLAVAVDDHDISYANFKGTIGAGYGAGKVEIYDSGYYELVDRKDKKIIVKLHGKKLKGLWALVNFKDKNWLFFKMKL